MTRSFVRVYLTVRVSLTTEFEMPDENAAQRFDEASDPKAMREALGMAETDLSGADLEGADLTGADLFQAIVDEAKLAGADLRGAEVSGLDLRRLATYQDLKITPDQQFRLLDAMGIDVRPE